MKNKSKFRKALGFFMLCLLGLMASLEANAQQKTITGTVTDEQGDGFPGVTIVVKGTTLGTITDMSGNYSLTDVSPSTTLIYSFIGMKSQEIVVGNQTTINISMASEFFGLDEVVAVGYGTQKRVNLTGAVGIADGEVLESRPIATIGQGLQGVLPGLNITIPSGDPTANVEFNIRGYESINGGAPLVLVDNVPMDLNQLNPNDIESISVLKDAASSAIYGARAAFGVILVTTKKGTKGKTRVTLSTEQTVTSPIYLIDPVTDPFVYMTNQNNIDQLNSAANTYNADRLADAEAYSKDPSFANEWSVRDNLLYYNGSNNYQDKVVTDKSNQKKYDFSISGASEEASYYASIGYLGKKGYLANDEKNQNFERINSLLRVDFKVNQWLSFDSKIVYTNTSNDTPHTYAFDASINSINRMSPIEPLLFPDLEYYNTPGDREDYEPFIGKAFDNRNTLPYLENGSRDTWTKHDAWFTQGLTITPFEGFVLKGDFSYNAKFQSVENVASKIDVIAGTSLSSGIKLNSLSLGNGFSGNDNIVNRTQYDQYFAYNVYGEYTYDKLDNHFFKGMVGFNQEESQTRRLYGEAATLINTGVIDLNATTGPQRVEGGRSQYALRGAFFRLNYDYRGKYLLEVNGRYDGTSRYPKDDRFGFFPSFSAGWRISEESFMDFSSSWLSNLKFRASYGELGNQIVIYDDEQDYYPYVPSLEPTTAEYTLGMGGLPIVNAAGLVSSTLTWESINTRNVGLDASFLNGKLDLTADMYVRETMDMLLRVDLPQIIGADAPLENGANLETKGWELAVNWRDRIGQDWKYSVGFNLSDNQTEITKYEGENPSINGFYEGKKIGEIWGFESVGLFESDAAAAAAPSQIAIAKDWKAGDMQYANLNDDAVIDRGTQSINSETGEFDKGDLKVIGNNTARYNFGFTPRVEYKAISLSMFFQGTLKRDYYPSIEPHAAFWPYNGDLVTTDFIENSWSATNTNSYFARPRSTDARNIQSQTRYLQNAAYVRLKNVTLNYNLPQNFIAKAGLSDASVYLSGQNLWEATGMRNTLDPEEANNDNIRHKYFFERSFSIGLKVTF